MGRRKIIWYTDAEINEQEETRVECGSELHYFAEDSAGNGFYWFKLETQSWGYTTIRYYLAVEDGDNDERCNHIFWFSTNCDDGEKWMHPSFKTPQEVRDYIKENDFIYKV